MLLRQIAGCAPIGLALSTLLLCGGPASAQEDRESLGRYAVLFRDRSFDLSAYRRAVRGELDADQVLAELEAAVHADQAEFVRFAAGLGARVEHQWWLVNGCGVRATAAQAAAIRRHSRVLDVQVDVPRGPGEFLRASKDDLNHDADAVHALGIRGKGVTVAVIDSGVDEVDTGRPRPHAAFYPNGNPANRTGGGMAGSRLLANVKVGQLPADDPIGHGTAVAGAVVAGRWNGTPEASEGIAPESRLVSYSVVDMPNGWGHQNTLTAAWQRVAADRIRYGIRVAVCSYFGIYDTKRVDAQAIDALARNSDIVVVGMAGNRPADPAFHYGAANMLAVGATETNTRKVASFSWLGPHLQDRARTYPHLVGNGVDIVLPLADAEATNRVSRGTSYSAPQVAGAAALYLSQRPVAAAAEVNAAILATAQPVHLANPGPYPGNNARNQHGVGFLHIERLVDLARNPSKGLVTSSSLTPSRTTATYSLSVQQGQRYAVALVWFRTNTNTTSAQWSNLDLTVDLGGRTVATGAAPRSAYEHVRFGAHVTGTATLTVTATSLEAGQPLQIFSLVAVPETREHVPARIRVFGGHCGPRLSLAADPMPYIGRTYVAELRTSVQPAPLAVLTLGVSKTRAGTTPLPLDLTPLGAPGCTLLTSLEATLPIPAPSSGARRVSIGIPRSTAMLGGTIYHQALVLEPGNALGVKLTEAIEATIGG